MAIPVVCFVGPSGVGKTTLLERVVANLTRRGFRVATIKHAHDGFQMDQPGKDSWRLTQAGSEAVLISSPHQVALLRRVQREPTLDELVPLLEHTADIILVEGYQRADKPTIEVVRSPVSPPPIHPYEKLLALVSDQRVPLDIPQFGLEETDLLVDFILDHEAVTKSTGSGRKTR